MTDTPNTAPSNWPVATLDGVARLRAIEAGAPWLAGIEGVIDAPYDEVWGWISDLERSTPEFDRDVTKIRVRSRNGPDLRIQAWTRALPAPVPFRVRLEDGFCLMQGPGRLYLVGMAARAEGGRTRVRHVEGVARAGLGRLAWPVVRRAIVGDLAGMTRHFERPGSVGS